MWGDGIKITGWKGALHSLRHTQGDQMGFCSSLHLKGDLTSRIKKAKGSWDLEKMVRVWVTVVGLGKDGVEICRELRMGQRWKDQEQSYVSWCSHLKARSACSHWASTERAGWVEEQMATWLWPLQQIPHNLYIIHQIYGSLLRGNARLWLLLFQNEIYWNLEEITSGERKYIKTDTLLSSIKPMT